jgi:outer membrane protein OmpA-like peptidoglycan-associated protein
VVGSTGAEGPSREGPTGPVGATGATGAQGLSGFVGARGNTEMAGVAGPTGATGATGAQGSVGRTGQQGPGGIAGAAGTWAPFRDIWFDTNRSEMRASEYSKVSDVVNYLNQNPNATVAIDGTNDRANSVRNALLQAGVPAYKIQFGTFGDARLQRDRQVQVLVSSR